MTEKQNNGNVFSKLIKELRTAGEQYITKQKEEEQRKRDLEEKEIQNWLKKGEEILIGDCQEAIRTITGEEFGTKKRGRVSFTSEAFIWFRDNRNMTLCRLKKVSELSDRERNQIIHNNELYQYKSQRHLNELIGEKIRVYTWSNDRIKSIFETISDQLQEENFALTTEDGVEFVLYWNSQKSEL